MTSPPAAGYRPGTFAERLRIARKHPFVAAWISAYQKDDEWRQYADCRLCGFPHSPHVLCGRGATFGELRIGVDTYYVDQSNVESFIEFREAPTPGFHWRDDVYFQSEPDGVKLTTFWQYNNCPQKRAWCIPMAEWRSIVKSMESA